MSEPRTHRLLAWWDKNSAMLRDGLGAMGQPGALAWENAMPSAEGEPALEGESTFGRVYFADGQEPRRVQTGRRREQQTAPQNRQRAESSRRQRPPSGSGGGGGYSSGGGGGGGFPTRAGGMGGIGLLLIIGFFILRSCMGGDSGGGGGIAEIGQQVIQQAAQSGALDQVIGGGGTLTTEGDLPPEIQQLLSAFGVNQYASGQVQEISQPAQALAPAVTVASAPVSTVAAGGSAGGDTWTIMLYQDADDQVLERDIHVDLNEAERANQSPNVNVVAQIDRYRGGYSGDGNITGAKRYLVQHDEDLNRVGSRELMDIGEPNMADPNTLVDFVVWAMENYPADKYALILSDHGMGWPGGWTDPTAPRVAVQGNPLSQQLGDMLYLNEIDDALAAIRQRTGLDKFELIGFDACLMAHMEVFSAMEPHARYVVASQETEPAVGWAYAAFLNELVANPEMTGGQLGQAIINTYIVGDQRILDANARAEFARGSAQAVAQQLQRGVTLTAADLSQYRAFSDAFNNYLLTLQGVDQRSVSQARSYAQSFTSVFGSNVPPSYLDIGHFLLLTAQQTQSQEVLNAARPVAEALQNLVIGEMHGQDKPSATGLSIYFPNSQLIRSSAGLQSYGAVAQRFVNESLWDDFLYFHYTGETFEPAQAARTATVDPGAMRSPGAGGISVSPVWASAESVAIQETVLLTTLIDGENVGYVKLLVGEFDENANSLRLIDADYLDAPETIEMRGSYYPEWGEGAFILEFDWEPYVTAITDGETNATVLMNPENYGKSSEDAVYSVDGIYNGAQGTRYARMYFRDGAMTEVFGFNTSEDGAVASTGAPWQLTPQDGDTFTVLETWLDFNEDGSATQVQQEGPTLTISLDEPLRWIEMDAAAGQYTVGFIVEDLDGNEYPTHTQIEVLP